MSRTRSCNCRCECCTCPIILDEFKVRINESYDFPFMYPSGDITYYDSFSRYAAYGYGAQGNNVLSNLYDSVQTHIQHSIIQFSGIDVEQSTVLNSGVLVIYSVSSTTDDGYMNVYCEDIDNATTISSGPDVSFFTGLTKTTNYTPFNLTSVAAIQELNVDITDSVQEVLDRSGWVSGNALNVMIETQTTNNFEYQWVNSGGLIAKLYLDYDRSFVDASSTLCQTIDPIKSYKLASECRSVNRVSDEITDCNLIGCPNVGRHWYLTEVDNCRIVKSGDVSCDGALLGLGTSYHYTYGSGYIEQSGFEYVADDPLPSGCDLHLLDPSGTKFRLSVCCFNDVSRKQFNVQTLCDESPKERVCQKCDSSSITMDLFGPLATGQTPITICDSFNFVGVAPKLYDDFYHEYDNICNIDCKPLNDTWLGPEEDPSGYPDRNFKRFWSLSPTINTRNLVVPSDTACCLPTAFGEIDIHGRLISSTMSFVKDITIGSNANDQSGYFPDPLRPTTCSYCMEGSYHWDPVLIWNMTGLILSSGSNLLERGSESEPFSLLTRSGDGSNIAYDTHCMFDNIGNPSGQLDNTIHGASLNHEVSEWQFFGADFHTNTQIWTPVFSGRIPPTTGTPYYLWEMQDIERNDVSNPENNFHVIVDGFRYDDGSLDENNDPIPSSGQKGGFFEIDFYLEGQYYREDLTVRSEYICPTVREEGGTFGRIDCNLLTRRGLHFRNIISQTQTFSTPQFIIDQTGVILNNNDVVPIIDDIDLHIITNPSGLGPMHRMILSRFHDPDSSGRIPYDDEDYCGIAIERKHSVSTVDNTPLTYELRTCCCDNQTIANYNIAEMGVGTAYDPDLICNCSGYTYFNGAVTRFNPVELCNSNSGNVKTLLVAIIDEADSSYTGCECSVSENPLFLSDLEDLRTDYPLVDFVILQPVPDVDPEVECDSVPLVGSEYLSGKCPLPEEVILYQGSVPRNDPDDTFTRLYNMFSTIVININNTGYNYYYIIIVIDDSGSTSESEFIDGVNMFVEWAQNYHPTVFVRVESSTNEEWLQWPSDFGAPSRLPCKTFTTGGGAGCDTADLVNTPV